MTAGIKTVAPPDINNPLCDRSKLWRRPMLGRPLRRFASALATPT